MQSIRILGTVLLLAGIAAPSARSESTLKKVATVEGISEYRLENGVRVLLFPDASRPKVTVNLTVLVGSRHEGLGETGMAHLLEHMVFKGTPSLPEVPKALRDHGANFNGTTWVDRTNYYEIMPASNENLEFAIRLEADRLVNSFIRREDLISEMTVVRNEFESGENSPASILSQRMMAVAYEWHNYGKSTIGNRSDIERVPVENLRAFYKKYYQPDNVVLTIAGKFDEAQAQAYVAKYFGTLKRPERTLEIPYTEEPAQDGERLVTLRRVGTVAALGAVYHIPAGMHADFPAIQLLVDILDSEPTGRLYKALVETKLATTVGGEAFSWHDPGAVEFVASCEPAKLEAAKKAFLDVLENLAKNPVTDEEMNRAKTKWAKQREEQMSASDRVAIALSDWAAKGDWRLFFVHRDRVEKVTTADVNRVAAKYFVRNNRTLGEFIPTQKPERVAIEPTTSINELVDNYKGRAVVAAGEEFDPTPANIDARMKTVQVEGVKVGMLPRKTRGETVTLQLQLQFGNESALKGHTTAASLLGGMLTRGTKQHTRQQLKDELDRLGLRMEAMSTPGTLTVSMTGKKATLPAGLALLQEVLRSPSFPANEFELLKNEYKERLDQGLTDPNALAIKLLQRTINPYPPADVRYEPTIEEELSRLAAATLEEVAALYQQQIGAANGQLAVVGDFDPDEVVAAIKPIVTGWKAPVAYQRIERPAVLGVAGAKEKIKTPDKANAIYLAATAFRMTDADPDYAAMEVANYVYGGGPLSSRLANRIRQKEGLSYGVASMFSASSRDPNGRMMMFAIANPDNINKVDSAMADELDKFLKEGVTFTELQEGKKAFLESQKLQRSNDRALTNTIVKNLDIGRTFAFTANVEKKISELNPDDIAAAFRKHVNPKNVVIVEAGDFK